MPLFLRCVGGFFGVVYTLYEKQSTPWTNPNI